MISQELFLYSKPKKCHFDETKSKLSVGVNYKGFYQLSIQVTENQPYPNLPIKPYLNLT
jgi:hypothetical protein